MRGTVARGVGITVILATSVFTAAPVRADDAKCVSAFEETQRLRKLGKLVSARDEAQICSASACPPVVQKQCTQWLEEIEPVVPTAIVVAQGRGGAAPDGLQVEIDGAPVKDPNSGRAMPIDPGTHRARATAPGHNEAQTTFVVAEGDKRVKIALTLEPVGAKMDTRPEGPPGAEPSRPVPALTWILGGVGIAALGTGTVFSLDGLGRKSSLDDSGCKPDCDQKRYDTMSRNLVVGDVLIGVGVVAIVAATVVYLTR
jgi:hypothetical protein